MDILLVQILAVTIWAAAVAFIVRNIIIMGRTYDRERSMAGANLDALSDRSAAYAACFKRCLNDYLSDPRKESICKDNCALCYTGTC